MSSAEDRLIARYRSPDFSKGQVA